MPLSPIFIGHCGPNSNQSIDVVKEIGFYGLLYIMLDFHYNLVIEYSI